MSGKAPRQRHVQVSPEEKLETGELSLVELQAVVDGATGGGIRLHDPAWLTHFRLHHRQAERYRAGRVFLAGDAGHIHSPVGAQGMNTGIQDAWNLGWKLALVVTGAADPRLLDTYEAERWPVGRALLRYTDRIFGIFTRSISSSAIAAWLRRSIVARVLPRVLRMERLRAFGFRFVAEFSIRYRNSPAVTEGTPRLRAGPRAGDRLPDAELTLNDQRTTLQRELAAPGLHLLLCGPLEDWTAHPDAVPALTTRCAASIAVHHLTRTLARGALVDATGSAFERLGIRDHGVYLVRPDGYIAYRCAGTDLRGLEHYLGRWYRIRNR